MAAHDPTKKPTPAKVLQGFKQFEEGFVIYEALNKHSDLPLPMHDMWAALAIYREVANQAAKEIAEKSSAKAGV